MGSPSQKSILSTGENSAQTFLVFFLFSGKIMVQENSRQAEGIEEKGFSLFLRQKKIEAERR